MSQSIEQWYHNMPRITKMWFQGVALMTVLVTAKMVSPYALILNFEAVISQFQIWRLLSCFLFFGGISFNLLIQVFMLVRYTSELETNYYPGNRGSAELTYLLGIAAVMMLVISYIFPYFFILGPSMQMVILYIWSRKQPDAPVSVYGFLFQAWHMPFVMLALTLLMGGNVYGDLLGIFVGHSLHFAQDLMPGLYGIRPITCPQFLYDSFEGVQNAGYRARGPGVRLGAD